MYCSSWSCLGPSEKVWGLHGQNRKLLHALDIVILSEIFGANPRSCWIFLLRSAAKTFEYLWMSTPKQARVRYWCVCVLLRCVFLLGASWRLIPGFEQKVAVRDIEFESTRAFRCLHGCCQMFTRHKCGKQKAAELWQCQLSEMLLGVYMALLYQRQLHLVLGGPFQPPRNPISALKFNWGDIIALLPQPLATQLNVYSHPPGNKHSNSKITGTCQVFQDFPSTSSIRHIHGHDWHKDA